MCYHPIGDNLGRLFLTYSPPCVDEEKSLYLYPEVGSGDGLMLAAISNILILN